MSNTTTEAEIRRLVGEGLNFVEIAKRLDVNVGSLRQAASILGIRSAYRLGGGLAVAREYLADIARGDTLTEIAARNGITYAAVHHRLKAAGLPTCTRAYLKATVAQSVEQPTCKERVAGSIPARGSIALIR